jgi:hypothetical protein
MTRAVTLSGGKAGISRQRIKGGASQDTFYDLRDCRRTASGTIIPRPGSRRAVSVPGTVGMVTFGGKFVVFAGTPTASPGPSVVVEVLTHPTGDTLATLQKVVYAKPHLGYLYVVASWSDEPTVFYHYWLQRFQNALGRKPLSFWAPGETIEPSTPNGYGYVAERFGTPYPAWSSGQVKTVGDRVDPTTFAGFALEVDDVFGANPATGKTEPPWSDLYGLLYAVAIDSAEDPPKSVFQPTVTTPPPTVDPDTRNRYGNMYDTVDP